jgi:hypothetical protein
MNDKCRSLIFRNSNILRLKKISLRHIFPIVQYKGGAINGKTKFSILYDNIEYKFYESSINENNYILYNDYDKDNPVDCVIIIMSKIDDTEYYQAEIHGIGNDKSCLHDSTTNISVGSLLLKITLKMLKKYHKKLNIRHIILTDNSLKFCDNIKDSIQLSLMLTLLTGHTWYGKYGFRPFNDKLNNYDDILINNYNKNIEIINSITIEKANILKYIELTDKKQIIDDVIKLLETNPNMLLKDFLTFFLKEYQPHMRRHGPLGRDKTCKYFYKFYRLLYQDIGLFDFQKKLFGLIY